LVENDYEYVLLDLNIAWTRRSGPQLSTGVETSTKPQLSTGVETSIKPQLSSGVETSTKLFCYIIIYFILSEYVRIKSQDYLNVRVPLPRILLLGRCMLEVVIVMKVEVVDELLTELNTSDTVTHPLEGRRPEAHAHHVRHHEQDDAGYGRLCGKSNLKESTISLVKRLVVNLY